MSVAVTVKVPAVLPAVNRPEASMVPPVALHVTEEFAVAVNCCVPPSVTVAVDGVTVAAGFMVTVAWP